jgi:hypothetical protein
MDLLNKYLRENDLLGIFQQQFREHDINLEELLTFAVNHGLYQLCKELYIHYGVKYNTILLNGQPYGWYSLDQFRNTDDQPSRIISHETALCIKLLDYLKRYSTLTRDGKDMFYTFNPKYIDKISVIDNIILYSKT